MRVISVLNLKGGVAKTFTAANVAYELYRRGYRVLLIDNDKQGNLSKAYSRYDAENIAPVTKLLAGDWCNVDELIQHTDYEGIDIVTANMSLFGATWNLTKEDSENQIERYKTLVYAKVQYYGDCTVYGKYDYCIIDNPPDIGLNVVNALAITDEVIVPVKVDEDALEGLDIVTEQIEDAKAFNPALKLAGVLITSYQRQRMRLRSCQRQSKRKLRSRQQPGKRYGQMKLHRKLRKRKQQKKQISRKNQDRGTITK